MVARNAAIGWTAMQRDPNNPADFDHAELLSYVEDESNGVPVPDDVRRRIDADPELRAAYDELKESVRVLRALPLRCAPPDVWGKLADAYERELGSGRDVEAGLPHFSEAHLSEEAHFPEEERPVRSRSFRQPGLRIALRFAAAAVLLVAAGWGGVALFGGGFFGTGGSGEWRAPNGLEFVAVDAARVTGISAPPESIPAEMAVLGFMTKTQLRFVEGGGSSGGNSSGGSSSGASSSETSSSEHGGAERKGEVDAR